MEEDHPAIELRRQLESSITQKDQNNLRFVSKATIDRFWPDDDGALKTQLGLRDWEDATLLDILREECRTIACILCWMQYNPYSKILQQICEQTPNGEQSNDPPVWRDTRLPLSDSTCADLLGYQAGQLFYLTQFIFTPIVISSASKGVQEVHPERRWPYNEPPKDIGFGAYGRVFKVSIVKGHLKDTEDSSNDEVRDVACKKVGKPADWRKEVKNLDFLKESLSGHKRLLLHLAAIIQSQDFYIFLPYTKLGDLETFFREGTWQDDDSVVQNIYDFTTTFRDFGILDLAREFAAIIDATAFLHDRVSSVRGIPVFCAHADLRPQNILIFPGGPENPAGIWHISDFGISAVQLEGGQALPDPKWLTYPSMGDIFEGRWSPSGAQSIPRKLIGPHVAPETSMDGISKPKEGDVWSLGCILTEILAFSLGTSKPGSRRGRLEEFRVQRRSFQGSDRNDYFFDRSFSTPSARSEIDVSIKQRSKVTEWLQWFYESKTGLHRDLAAVANRMLQPNPEQRCTAKDAYDQIYKAYNACTSKAPVSDLPEDASSQPQRQWAGPIEWRFQAVQDGGHSSDGSLTFVKNSESELDPISRSQSTNINGKEASSIEDNLPDLDSLDFTGHFSFQRTQTTEASTGVTRPWKVARNFSKPALSAAISDSRGIVVYLCKIQKVYQLEFRTIAQESWKHELPTNVEWQHVRAEGKHAITTGAGSNIYIYDFEEQREIDLPDSVSSLNLRKFLPLSSGAFVAHDEKRLAFWHIGGSVHEPNLPADLGHSGQVVFGSTELFWFTWSCQPQGDTVIIWAADSKSEPRVYATYTVPRPRHARPKLMSLIPCGSLPACCLWDGYRTWYTASAGSTASTDSCLEATVQPKMSGWFISGTLCVANERHFFFIAPSKEIFSCDLLWQDDSTLSVKGEPRLLSETSMDHPHKLALHSKGDGKYELIIYSLRGAVESLEVEC